jgi:hypothetical protein
MRQSWTIDMSELPPHSCARAVKGGVVTSLSERSVDAPSTAGPSVPDFPESGYTVIRKTR